MAQMNKNQEVSITQTPTEYMLNGTDEYLRFFPKEKCYPNQKDAMDNIHSALLIGNLILFEGACGTGKTLSALAPALHVGKTIDKTIIIATSVHQQMVQFIQEAKDIKKSNDIKVVVLKGKTAMCAHGIDYEECKVKKENTYDLIKLERELNLKKIEVKSANEKYKESKDRSYIELRNELSKELDAANTKAAKLRNNSCNDLYEVLHSDNIEFKNWLFSGVRAPEEVNEYAINQGMCGYELLKKEIKHADLIICNFNHVLNNDIFNLLLGWLEKEPNEVIVILDEAHNIEASARSHSSDSITEHTLEKAMKELEFEFTDAYLLFRVFFNVLKEFYASTLKFGDRERIGNHWIDIRISDPKKRDDKLLAKFLNQAKKEGFGEKNKILLFLTDISKFGESIENKNHDDYKKGVSGILKRSSVRLVADFLSKYIILSNNLEYYPILNIKRDMVKNEVYGRIELSTCIPKNITEQLFNSVYSAILMSATLRPFDMMKSVLGINRPTIELAYKTTFSIENRLTATIQIPPLIANNRSDPAIMATIESVLLDIIEYSIGNVIIFFQSSAESKRYFNKLKLKISKLEESIPLFLDETGVSSQQIREDFFKIGENSKKAVLLSYLWGTLSEGVDYRDGRGRTVVIVGIGYPALNDRMKAIEFAYNHTFGAGTGWEYAVLIPTIRKIRQAMGRVVRSPHDYGARILMDSRFSEERAPKLKKHSVYNIFPDDEKEEFIDVENNKLKYALSNFYNEMNGTNYD